MTSVCRCIVGLPRSAVWSFSEDCLPGDRRTQCRTTTTAVPNEGLETTEMTTWDGCVAELYGFSLKEYEGVMPKRVSRVALSRFRAGRVPDY
jgi:hypothetical protein